MVCFANRHEAGEKLAQVVLAERSQHPVEEMARFVVYALPRGGLLVAAPVARSLECPLDVIVAKKITRPENTELAIGAVTADGHALWLPRSRSPHQPAHLYEMALHQARERAREQLEQLAPCRPQVTPQGTIALIVDDGIATGMTMAVAAQALRAQQPAQIWICVPIAPPEIMPFLESWCDRVIVLATPSPFNSVSRFYKQFPQVEIEEARACLQDVNEGMRG
ncbi:MAG: phosphoribosyltransferase [Leptolyngbyaceae cyanobacterium RU_5_1]|nr:phosphoribosyltransferase [Leptolyngbyaceae cyanobacterium RU_5_1]